MKIDATTTSCGYRSNFVHVAAAKLEGRICL